MSVGPLQHVQRKDTKRIPKQHYNIDQKDEGTYDDRGRHGGTNFILRIKEQETRLTLHEHDDYDDDDEIMEVHPALVLRPLLHAFLL